MPEEAQGKFKETLQRIINEGSGELIGYYTLTIPIGRPPIADCCKNIQTTTFNIGYCAN